MIMFVFIAGAFCFCGWRHWQELDSKSPSWKRLLFDWTVKGIAFPALVWALVNLGLFRKFPPFVPRLAEAQAHHWPWFFWWVEAAIVGLAAVAFCWAAVTYSWIFGVILARSQQKLELALTAGLVG